jgi:hypothetical protein
MNPNYWDVSQILLVFLFSSLATEIPIFAYPSSNQQYKTIQLSLNYKNSTTKQDGNKLRGCVLRRTRDLRRPQIFQRPCLLKTMHNAPSFFCLYPHSCAFSENKFSSRLKLGACKLSFLGQISSRSSAIFWEFKYKLISQASNQTIYTKK